MVAMREKATPTSPPVDEIRNSLQALVRERQDLRTTGADEASLEQNRKAIVERQWEYARALIARHAA
jgi:hypothetical protein